MKLANTVLISNSIPKSGSSLLFVLQRAALNLAAEKTNTNYEELKKRGIAVTGGYIPDPNAPEFLNYLQEGQIDGPLAVKTHALIGPELRDMFEEMPNLFISLSVRDPLDVLLSAQSNFRKTGEFGNFEDLKSGCGVVNDFYRKIYSSTIEASRVRPIPIIRYTDILRDKTAAVAASFDVELRALAPISTISQVIGVREIEDQAAHRMDTGAEVRDKSNIDPGLLADIKRELYDFRLLLGYDTE